MNEIDVESYCIFRNDTLFAIGQVINITAIVATIALALRSDRICPYHSNGALKVAGTPKMTERIQLQKEPYVGNTNDV